MASLDHNSRSLKSAHFVSFTCQLFGIFFLCFVFHFLLRFLKKCGIEIQTASQFFLNKNVSENFRVVLKNSIRGNIGFKTLHMYLKC
jgi:hypothetical protein